MTPARLQKQDDIHRYNSLSGRIESFLTRHALFFLCLFMMLLFILVTILAYIIVGVSATESGAVYNHLGDII